MSVKRLFKHSVASARDGLTQRQREAIVDLLHICMFADRQLMIAEDAVINQTLHSLEWAGDLPIDAYERTSIEAARRAVADSDERGRFLRAVVDRLDSENAKRVALETAEVLLYADSLLPSERRLLSEIEKVLKK